MAQIESTATVHLKQINRKQAGAYARHNQHASNVNHSNTNIVFADTELNSFHQIHDLDALLHAQYDEHISEFNKDLRQQFIDKKISATRYAERQKSIDDYKNKNAFTAGVMTIGDAGVYRQVLDAMGVSYEMQTVGAANSNGVNTSFERPYIMDRNDRDLVSRFFGEVYSNAASKIDGPGLPIASIDVHLDEGGAPHGHTIAVDSGKTKKGKPSTSMNAAIAAYLGDDAVADTRSNMREYRKRSDNALIDSFNSVSAKYGFEMDLKLVRTGKSGGRSMNEYKSFKATQSSIQSQVSSLNSSLASERSSFASLTDSVAHSVSDSRAIADSIAASSIAALESSANASVADYASSVATSIAAVNSGIGDQRSSLAFATSFAADSIDAASESVADLSSITEGNAVDVIEALDSEHKVPKYRLSANEEPEPVSTVVGRQQHRQQPFSWLLNTIRLLLQRIRQLRRELDSKQSKFDNLGDAYSAGVLDGYDNAIDALESRDAARSVAASKTYVDDVQEHGTPFSSSNEFSVASSVSIMSNRRRRRSAASAASKSHDDDGPDL